VKSKKIAGIDEAGRGAVLGPMVIAGVSIPEESEAELRKIGVRDSKELSQNRRVILAKQIEEIAKDIVIMKVSPCRIDDYNRKGVKLNMVEAMRMGDIIDMLRPAKIYVDSPESNTAKFANLLRKLSRTEAEIISENKADQKYPVVSAASIIAKVEREKEVDKLKRQYGIRGSGYPADERTIGWMKEYLQKHGKFPEKGLVRFSWDTTKQMLGTKKQKGLLGFLKK
jgi:ribonuclease HII